MPALVIGTSGASYAGFKTAAEAYKDYFNAKAQGYVRVVGDYGDEAIYRPLSCNYVVDALRNTAYLLLFSVCSR